MTHFGLTISLNHTHWISTYCRTHRYCSFTMFMNASGWMCLRCCDSDMVLKERHCHIVANINHWSQNYRVSASYTYIWLSSGRSEKAKAPILSSGSFFEMWLRETQIYKYKSSCYIFNHTLWRILTPLPCLQLFGWSVFSEFVALLVPWQRLNTRSTLDKIRHAQSLSESVRLTFQSAEGGRQRQKLQYSPVHHYLRCH